MCFMEHCVFRLIMSPHLRRLISTSILFVLAMTLMEYDSLLAHRNIDEYGSRRSGEFHRDFHVLFSRFLHTQII